MKSLFLIFFFPLYSLGQTNDTILEIEQTTFDASGVMILSIYHDRNPKGKELKMIVTKGNSISKTIFEYDSLNRIVNEKNYLPDDSTGDSVVYDYYSDRFVKSEYSIFDTNFIVNHITTYTAKGIPLFQSIYHNEYGIKGIDTIFFDLYGNEIESRYYALEIETNTFHLSGCKQSKWSEKGLLLEELTFQNGKLERVTKNSYNKMGEIHNTEYSLDSGLSFPIKDQYTYWEEKGILFRKCESDRYNGYLINQYSNNGKLLDESHYLTDGTIRNRTSYKYDEKGFLVFCKKEHLSTNQIITTTIYKYSTYRK
ncbi:hypothetical protein D3C71_614480 [compost metagenome]